MSIFSIDEFRADVDLPKEFFHEKVLHIFYPIKLPFDVEDCRDMWGQKLHCCHFIITQNRRLNLILINLKMFYCLYHI